MDEDARHGALFNEQRRVNEQRRGHLANVASPAGLLRYPDGVLILRGAAEGHPCQRMSPERAAAPVGGAT